MTNKTLSETTHPKSILPCKLIADLDAAEDALFYSQYITRIQFSLPDMTLIDAKVLKEYYQPKLDELSTETITPAKLKLINFYKEIIAALPVPKERKPRTKKPPTFKNFKCVMEFEGLTGNLPTAVHGKSSTLITYNTKYNLVTVFVAEEGKYLEISGTSIVNYDEKKSFAKKVKPVKFIPIVKSGGRAAILEHVKTIKSNPKFTGRCSSTTMFLRVYA